MAQFFLIIVVLVLAIMAMAVRMFLIKGSEMRAGCAGKNPLLQEEGVACGQCGAMPGDTCKSED